MSKKSTKANITEKKEAVFKNKDYAVYPSHGVGQIIDTETMQIAGQEFSTFTIFFEKEKLTIKVPTSQIEKIGIRHLISKEKMEEVFGILKSGVKKLKGMWSRRAQEYESKINSGDIVLLAEVLRDLTRDIADGDRSYSERIIYETAIYRLASEYAAIFGTSFDDAKEEIIKTAKNKLFDSTEVQENKVVEDDDFDDFDPDEDDSDSDDDSED